MTTCSFILGLNGLERKKIMKLLVLNLKLDETKDFGSKIIPAVIGATKLLNLKLDETKDFGSKIIPAVIGAT